MTLGSLLLGKRGAMFRVAPRARAGRSLAFVSLQSGLFQSACLPRPRGPLISFVIPQGKPNAKSVEPAAIATYSLPSIAYVIGEA